MGSMVFQRQSVTAEVTERIARAVYERVLMEMADQPESEFWKALLQANPFGPAAQECWEMLAADLVQRSADNAHRKGA